MDPHVPSETGDIIISSLQVRKQAWKDHDLPKVVKHQVEVQAEVQAKAVHSRTLQPLKRMAMLPVKRWLWRHRNKLQAFYLPHFCSLTEEAVWAGDEEGGVPENRPAKHHGWESQKRNQDRNGHVPQCKGRQGSLSLTALCLQSGDLGSNNDPKPQQDINTKEASPDT